MLAKVLPPRNVYVAAAGKKGLGVFASSPIAAGETIEIAHVREVPQALERAIEDLSPELFHYLFWWEGGTADAQSAVVFGFAPFYNHSRSPNLKLIHDFEDRTITFQTIKEVQSDEELTFDYDTKLWFDESE